MDRGPQVTDVSEPSAVYRSLKADELTQKIRAAKADADLAETLSDAAKLAHAKDVRRWEFETAGDADNRVFRFPTSISQDSVSAVIDTLSRWDRLDAARPDRTYELYLTSPGGNIMPGVSLYNFLVRLALKRPLVTVASGFCASMATVIHQAGTTRLIEAGTSYLIHDASSGAYGDVSSLRDQAEWIDRINTDLHRFLARRSTLTIEQIAEKSRRKDWTLTAEQTVEYGFADGLL
jgi:ATP-dependent Clp endopeptidase proteolytic subunit ClpP